MFDEKEVHIVIDLLRNKYKNLIITFVKNDLDCLRLSIFTNYIPINYIIEKVKTILLDYKVEYELEYCNPTHPNLLIRKVTIGNTDTKL